MIRLDGVHKRLEGKHAALAGVDLEIASGEIFGIIGRSGAGKSTLVRLLNGLERPSAATVTIDDIDIAELGTIRSAMYGSVAPYLLGFAPYDQRASGPRCDLRT